MKHPNAFASTFYFFATTQGNAKKIKGACKPTHGDTANLTRQRIECKSLLRPVSELQKVVLRGDSCTTAKTLRLKDFKKKGFVR